jgi:2-dehydro-3-deoxy-D-gluconate 5-dehydrogenase
MSMMDLFKLDGQVALVTGAARGLGAAIALGLAEAGADIAALDCLPVTATQQSIQAMGRQCLPLSCDLRMASVSDLNGVVDQVIARMGQVDILVNNAGIIRRAPVVETKEEEWDDVLQINLKAQFFLCQAAAKAMIPHKHGKIIQISSVLGFQGGILAPSYAATKHASLGLTRAMANEWAPLGINVNAIALGYMETELTSMVRADPERSAALIARIPVGRYGKPSDIQGTVVFLASAASDYMHGSTVVLDGGWLAR